MNEASGPGEAVGSGAWGIRAVEMLVDRDRLASALRESEAGVRALAQQNAQLSEQNARLSEENLRLGRALEAARTEVGEMRGLMTAAVSAGAELVKVAGSMWSSMQHAALRIGIEPGGGVGGVGSVGSVGSVGGGVGYGPLPRRKPGELFPGDSAGPLH